MTSTAASALALSEGISGRACIMQLGGGFPKLDLTEFRENRQAQSASNADLGLVRICLGTRDIAADYTRLTALGVGFISKPVACEARMADITVCLDPDGTMIELIQVYPEHWPRE